MPRSQRAGEIPVLPQVPAPPVARIVILRVPPVDPAQQDGKRVLPLRHHHQVDVIGHQTPAQHPRARVGEVQPYELQVGLAISIGGERLAPVHAALRHVARDAGDDTSFTPRHIPGSASAEARVSGKSHSSG